MSAVYETAYPRIKAKLSPKELAEIYTPTAEELKFVTMHTKQVIPKLGLLTLLKVFQRLGYFLLLRDIPNVIIKHIADCIGCDIPDALSSYDDTASRYRHLSLIRKFVGVAAYGEETRQIMQQAMENTVAVKDDIADIINVAIEELIKQKHELPEFSTFLRLAKSVRATVNQKYCRQISDLLTLEVRKKIVEILKRSGKSKSFWDRIKRSPGRPNINNVREWLEHLRWIREQNDGLPVIKNVPAVKLKKFAIEAMSLDVSAMNDLEYFKKFALATVLIQKQLAKALDDLAEMFIKQMQKLHSRAQEALYQYHIQHMERTDNLVALLREVITAYKVENSKAAGLTAMSSILPSNVDEILLQCDEYAAYANNNYYAFMPRFYKSKRKLLFAFLDNVVIASSSHDRAVEQAIKFLLEHKSSKKELLEIEELRLDLTWIPDNWRRLVIWKKLPASKLLYIDRCYFEICMFSQIMQELKSGDLYLAGSDEFNDYREQLISWEDYEATVATYGEQLGIPIDSTAFVAHLKPCLGKMAKATDDSFPDNEHVRIENGELVISKYERSAQPIELPAINTLISLRLKTLNILDVLADTENWLHWTQFFGPLSGFETKIANPRESYILTTFCYGCNLGPTQTARSIKGIERKHLTWINQRHITEEVLDKAIVAVINAYNRFVLPKFWGSGKSASADGTKWDLYEENLLSEYHIRYGGYGGIGYYHVSDQYIALFSHFIPCGVYEAVYILDGLLKNRSDIQPDTLHGDTHAQSYPVFALAYLLGIDLMPRIRSLKKLILFRPSKDTRFQHINSLFTEVIQWDLIEKHLPDMLRVVLSIKAGRIYPSTILKRLGTYSRKNKLYFAFRELGQVIRTIFLLRYLADVELRKTIHAATCKSEEFNNFIKWLFFGDEGIIAENLRHEQRKIVKYNHLVANLLILHNVNSITEILQGLTKEGYQITPEILAALSPYRTQHVNRFGSYTLDLNRKVTSLNYDLLLM